MCTCEASNGVISPMKIFQYILRIFSPAWRIPPCNNHNRIAIWHYIILYIHIFFVLPVKRNRISSAIFHWIIRARCALLARYLFLLNSLRRPVKIEWTSSGPFLVFFQDPFRFGFFHTYMFFHFISARCVFLVYFERVRVRFSINYSDIFTIRLCTWVRATQNILLEGWNFDNDIAKFLYNWMEIFDVIWNSVYYTEYGIYFRKIIIGF